MGSWEWSEDATCGTSLNQEQPPLVCVAAVLATSVDYIFNTNGFQEEVGRAEGVKTGAAVLHPGWFICCIRDIWARTSHHQGAFLRVMEEAQLQRGVHQEGGTQLSAATGKMFRGPRYWFPQRLIDDLGAGRGNGTGKAAVKHLWEIRR